MNRLFTSPITRFALCGFFVLSQIYAYSQSKWPASSLAGLPKKDGGGIRLLAEINDPSILPLLHEHRIIVGTKAGNIWTLTVPASEISWLEAQDAVSQLELSWAVQPAQKSDSVSHRSSWVQNVQGEPGKGISTNYNGKDIIVGIIDIGYQFDHPTYFDTTGNTFRVKRFWNQQDENGAPPQGFTYGSLYTLAADMWAHTDSAYLHANHVSGIAAGSGFGSQNRKFSGIAYDADLVCVNIKYSDQNYPGSAKGDLYVANAAIIDGLDYIFRYADSVGKPAVVNLSWGMHSGPHDGTSLFDKAIEQLTGQGKLFVGACGNDGNSPIHFGKFLNKDTASTIPYMYARQFRAVENMLFDVWGSPGTSFSIAFGLQDTSGNQVYISPFLESGATGNISGNYTINGSPVLEYKCSRVAQFAGNNSPNILVEIINYQPSVYWTTAHFTSDSSQLHAWNSGGAYEWTGGGFRAGIPDHTANPGFIGGNADYSVGENGGTGKRTISVGAYAVINSWMNILGDTVFTGHGAGQRAFFSSRGPTRDGRIKPDISAPGFDIISAYNRFTIEPADISTTAATTVFKGNTQYYGGASGTSMAAPHMTGIVALMLQANPALTPEDALLIIHNSAMQDQWTGNLPNTDWGYGKINAYKAVLLAQSPLSVGDEFSLTFAAFPNPANNRLYVEHNSFAALQFSYQVMTMDGKTVLSGNYQPDGINTSSLHNGIYFLKLSEGAVSKTLKMVVAH